MNYMFDGFINELTKSLLKTKMSSKDRKRSDVQLTLTITRRRRSGSLLARSPSSFSNGSVTVTYVGCPFGGNSH